MKRKDVFDEYFRATEPDKREKAYAWKTAIGLQQVDGLTTSDYLVATAKKNIEGEITLAESRKLIEGYYKSYPPRNEDERFFANLLLGEKNALKSRYLHISLSGAKGVSTKREQVREQVREQAVGEIKNRPTRQVQRLIKVLKGELTVLEMMARLKLGGRRNFLEKYLTPAIDAGLVEMTQPDSPHSPTQRYRLTEKGVGEESRK